MREIIFRAKRKDNGEWVYGNLITFETIHNVIYAIYTDCSDDYSGGHVAHCYDVNPETVGQYTGLKDKNGTRIFDGDIVKVETELVRGIFAVECSMGANFIVSHGERRFFFGGRKSEVIGNIHDNPELLEE